MSACADTSITRRAADAVTAAASRSRPAAHTARAWIDTLSARAQIRSERRVRHSRPQPATRWTP